MPYCPICEKCLFSTGRKGTDRKYQLGSNLRRHKALKASGPRAQHLNHDPKFGGIGIIGTKCGHLYHQNCLNEYITNYRTKGDCYGTTYNVLCPLCGSNLSNGKMLRIDLEAHFGILEEFFQDLCKLKYMNKELKRTVELEWADIADLEKKMKDTKEEYDHVRTIKRNNEQKCAQTQERISKAIEDARTCYRYREIEKQLIDENINLEAVARRMETIINTRIQTTSATSSPTSASSPRNQDKLNEEKDYNQNVELIPIKQELNDVSTVDHYQVTSDTDNHQDENNNSIFGSHIKTTHRQQVDISVQISVHSEWSASVNSASGYEVESQVVKKCQQKSLFQVCSQSTNSSTLLNSSDFSDSVHNLDHHHRKEDKNCRVRDNCDNVDKSLSYIVLKDVIKQEDDLEDKEIKNELKIADKSRSYTIQKYHQDNEDNLTKPNQELWPLQKFTSEESIDPLLRSLLYPAECQNNKQNGKFKSKIPIAAPQSQKLSNASQNDEYLQQQLANCVSSLAPQKNECSKQHLLEFLLGKCDQNNGESQTKITKSQVTQMYKAMQLINNQECLEQLNNNQDNLELKLTKQNEIPTSSLQLIKKDNEIVPSTSALQSKDSQKIICQEMSSHQVCVENYCRKSIKLNDQLNNNKIVITPPEMFASEKLMSINCSRDENMQLSFPPLPPIPSSRIISIEESHRSLVVSEKDKTVEKNLEIKSKLNNNEYIQLILPPPLPIEQIELLIVPPPPPMSSHTGQRQGQPYESFNCTTPESTRQLVDSLFTNCDDNFFSKTEQVIKLPSKKSVPNQGQVTTIKCQPNIINLNDSTGGGDVMKNKCITLQQEEDGLLNYIISSQTKLNEEPESQLAVPLNKFCSCLAAQHFVKENSSNEQTCSVQSVRVGVDSVDNHQHYSKQQQQHQILNNQYYYSRTIQQQQQNQQNGSLTNYHYGQNQNVLENIGIERENSYTNSSSYGNDHQRWSYEKKTSTPIVSEHKKNILHGNPYEMIKPNSLHYFSPQSSLTTLVHDPRPSLINNCWLNDSNLSLKSPHDSNFLTSRPNFN